MDFGAFDHDHSAFLYLGVADWGVDRVAAFARLVTLYGSTTVNAIGCTLLSTGIDPDLLCRFPLLPLGGGYSIGIIPNLSVSFILDILKHAILPSLAIILANFGGWAIGMRGMMVTVQGEDYMTFAEAKGLKNWRLFYKYAVRNALLPQVTGLALSFSYIVSGAVLVELVFGYPGIGSLLARAIQQLDYFTIYGVVFILIVAIGVAMFVMDMIYPLLDPRISYE